MYEIKIIIILLITIKVVYCQDSIIAERKNFTAEDLILQLSKLANSPRQRFPIDYEKNPNYPPYRDYYDYQNYIGQSGEQFNKKKPYQRYPIDPNLASNYDQFNSEFAPGFNPYLHDPFGIPPNPYDEGPFSSFIRALDSIAKHDERQCVPRLLCEVAAGGNSNYYRQNYYTPSSFFSLESLFTLLGAFAGEQMSPLLVFGRAAILGVTSRGNPSSCRYAYPECPRDPDRLVEYLNNHNGGFFRFFNGLQPQKQFLHSQGQFLHSQGQFPHPQDQFNHPQGQFYHPQGQFSHPQGQFNFPVNDQQLPGRPYPYPPYPGLLNYRPGFYGSQFKYDSQKINITSQDAEARIQNKPFFNNFPNDLYIAQSYYRPEIKDSKSWKFPESNSIQNKIPHLKFPTNHVNSYKKPKGLYFPNDNDENQNIFYPTPLPYYDHSKMIFPDRTGTGNLKFDAETLLLSTTQSPNYYYSKYYDNQYQPSKKKYLYIVRGNGDPNHPEIIEGKNGKKSRDNSADIIDYSEKRGTPWTFPSPYQGVIYND